MASVLELAEEIKPLATADSDIFVLWLYGSRAKGTAKADSDYDIAIAFKNFDLSRIDKTLRPQMLAIAWQTPLNLAENMISIVDINRCPLYLAINIINEGQVLVNKNTFRLMKEEARIRSMFEYLQIEQRRYE